MEQNEAQVTYLGSATTSQSLPPPIPSPAPIFVSRPVRVGVGVPQSNRGTPLQSIQGIDPGLETGNEGLPPEGSSSGRRNGVDPILCGAWFLPRSTKRGRTDDRSCPAIPRMGTSGGRSASPRDDVSMLRSDGCQRY